MSTVKVFVTAFVIGSLAIAGTALAQGVDVKLGVGIPLSPGQQGTSPGKAFNAARALDPTAPSPGKLFLLNKAADPTTALPPGQTVTNYGRSKK
jgi:hypothetical protein